MLQRIIFLGVLTSIIQIALFGLLYDFASNLHAKIYQYSPSRKLDWGITLHYIFIFYSLLIASINIILTFSSNLKISYILLVLLILIFDIWLFQNFQHRPYKVVLIFTLSNFLLVLSIAVERYLSRTLSKKAHS